MLQHKSKAGNSLFSSYRKRLNEPVSEVYYSPSSNEEINRYGLHERLRVVDAVILLQHHRYREEKKVKLNLEIDGREVWALDTHKLWIFFHTEPSSSIHVHWVAQKSKFRP